MLRHLAWMPDLLQRARRSGQRLCGVVLSWRQGPSYRPVGSWMAVGEDGHWQGGITAGCLEPWIAQQAVEALKHARPGVLQLDTREDGEHGLALGCGGLLELCLFPLMPEHDYQPLSWLDPVLTQPLDLYLAIRGNCPQASLQPPPPAMDGVVRRIRYRPAPRILLLGSSADLPPVARLLLRQGWQVEAADLVPLRGQARVAHRVLDPRTLQQAMVQGNADAILVMSHDLARDRLFLETIDPDRPPRWLGLIGAASRCHELLRDCGLDPDASWIHAPAGLPIGAHDPEAIAVSVVAQPLRDNPDDPVPNQPSP